MIPTPRAPAVREFHDNLLEPPPPKPSFFARSMSYAPPSLSSSGASSAASSAHASGAFEDDEGVAGGSAAATPTASRRLRVTIAGDAADGQTPSPSGPLSAERGLSGRSRRSSSQRRQSQDLSALERYVRDRMAQASIAVPDRPATAFGRTMLTHRRQHRLLSPTDVVRPRTAGAPPPTSSACMPRSPSESNVFKATWRA